MVVTMEMMTNNVDTMSGVKYYNDRRCKMDKLLYVFLWPSELAATLAVWLFVGAIVISEVLR